MRLRNILIIYRKELTDMMRDRRTMFGMLLFPLILFPLMTVGFNSFEAKMRAKVKQESATIALIGAERAAELAERLRGAEGLEVGAVAGDVIAQINEKKMRAAVEFPENFESALRDGSAEPPVVKVLYYATETRSESARRKIEEVISAYRQDVVVRRLGARGLSEGFVKPVKTEQENVAAAEKVSGMKLGLIVPYFIIFLSLMGAMHPAMDVTAGEKERGTMETILASSVHRGEIVLGKFLLVLTASLTTTIVSLASFGVTASRSKTYLGDLAQGHTYQISPQAIGSILLLVLPLAVLFASALVAVSTAAKSYKEAQSYASPLMILVILPALAGILPGVELTPALAMVPITNVSLVTRELLTGGFPVLFMTITFLSTCVYAGAALYFAYRQFQREEVLFRT